MQKLHSELIPETGSLFETHSPLHPDFLCQHDANLTINIQMSSKFSHNQFIAGKLRPTATATAAFASLSSLLS